MSRVRKKS